MASPMTPNSPILGPTDPTATVAAALAYVDSRDDRGPVVNMPGVDAYVRELHRLCLLAGIRFEAAFPQACDESNVFRDETYWGAYGNPVGFGAEETLDRPGDINYTGGSWTPVGAARVHLVHLWLYASGTVLPAALALYKELDTRWHKAIAAGYAGKAPTLAGLATRWAVNPNYAVQIAAHANRAFPRLGTTPAPPKEKPTMPTAPKKLNMAKGIIPLPGFNDENDTFTKRDGVGMNLLGPRIIDVLFFHRALGEDVQGVADWLQRPDVQGMTDWAIDDDTALMIRIEKIEGKWTDMSGWAQGPYRAPTADLRKLTAKYGGSPDTINKHGESIEVAGFYDDPISEACKADLVLWTASRAQDRGIEWGDFPYTPDGYSFIYGHREACGIDYKVCPGSVVWSFINDGELIERTRKILRAAQEGKDVPTTPVQQPPSGGKPTYAKARPIAALAALELDDVAGLAAVIAEDGQEFRKVTDQVVAINDTPRFQIASITSTARVGPNIKTGEDFNPAWEFTAKDGEEWYLTPYWTRVRKQDTRVVGVGPLTA